jgi:hypothetical protein
VIAPAKLPLPVALAEPARTRTKTAAAAVRKKAVRREWCFTWPPPVWAIALTAHIYRDITEFKREFDKFLER